MPNKNQHSAGANDLRRRAEQSASERAARLSVPGLESLPEDASRMVHELEVRQIELEMQNSELERARAELEAAQAVYRELFEWSSDAVFLIASQSGRVMDANQMAVTLYGYGRAELLAKTSADLSGEPEVTSRRTQEAGLQPGQVFQIPLRLHRKKDGSVFPVSITVRSIAKNGQALPLVSCRDLTEQRRAAEALKKESASLNEVIERNPIWIQSRSGSNWFPTWPGSWAGAWK